MTNLLRSQIYKLFHNMIFWAGAALTICSVLFYAVFESMKAETVANGMPLFQYHFRMAPVMISAKKSVKFQKCRLCFLLRRMKKQILSWDLT